MTSGTFTLKMSLQNFKVILANFTYFLESVAYHIHPIWEEKVQQYAFFLLNPGAPFPIKAKVQKDLFLKEYMHVSTSLLKTKRQNIEQERG